MLKRIALLLCMAREWGLVALGGLMLVVGLGLVVSRKR